MALRKVIEDKTKLEGEMIQLRGQIRSLRNEKEAAEEEVGAASFCVSVYGQAWKGLSFSAGIEGLSFSVLVLPAFVSVCMGRHGRDCHLVQG